MASSSAAAATGAAGNDEPANDEAAKEEVAGAQVAPRPLTAALISTAAQTADTPVSERIRARVPRRLWIRARMRHCHDQRWVERQPQVVNTICAPLAVLWPETSRQSPE